jgi:hypothetical protein
LGGDLMDAVSLKLARNYTNEKLNSLPSNAPTKTVTFDGGIYSVGSDVVNGQVSDVVLKGRTYTNILKNSNFDDGLTDWISGNNRSTEETSIVLNGSKARRWTLAGSRGSLKQPVSVYAGKKYLLSVWVYIVSIETKGDTGLRTGGTLRTPIDENIIGSWQRLSYLYEPSSDGTVEIRFGSFAADANIDVIFDSAIIVDITNSELATADEAEVGIPVWFTGTKSTNSVRLRSVNEDETKESIAYVNLPRGEELRSLPNGVKDEVNVTSGIKTQRVGNKTNVASGTVINYTDMATAGQFEAWGSGEHVVGVKGDTLAFTATSLNYQLAEPIVTKLPAQAPLQVFENGTVYVEPIGDPSETTLPTVELTIPTGTSNKFGVATHDYGGAAADWVLTKNEANCGILIVTNAGGTANIIAPNDLGRFFFVKNDSGYDVVVKSAGAEAGTTIADGNSVIVFNTGD